MVETVEILAVGEYFLGPPDLPPNGYRVAYKRISRLFVVLTAAALG
jgi:hypothetical protein